MGANKNEKAEDDEKLKYYVHIVVDFGAKKLEDFKEAFKSFVANSLISVFVIPAVAIAFLSLARRVFKHRGDIKGLLAKPKHKPIPPEVLTQYGSGSYIQLKYMKMHYVSKGNTENPLLIFLHGFPEFWYSWRKQIDHFSENYHVVAIDLRGYGDSEKPVGTEHYKLKLLSQDVKHFIDIFDMQDAIFVGHDLGAIVIYDMLIRYPEYVSKYVVLSVPPQYAFNVNIRQTMRSWYAVFFQLRILPEIYLSVYDLELGLVDVLYKNITREEAEAYKFVLGKPGILTSMLNHYRANLSYMVKTVMFGEPNFETVKEPAPGLLIYGDNDPFVAKKSFEKVKNLKNLTVQIIPNGGHFIQYENADIVNDYISKFLKTEEQKPDKQKPIESKPDEQKPTEPKSDEQKPSEQKPTEPKSDEQKSSEQKADGQKPSERKTDEQKASEQKPNKQKSSEPKLDKQKPSEQKPTEPKSDEQKPSEQKADGQKPSERKTDEQKASEQKPNKQKPSEPKLDEPKLSERKADEQKPSENKKNEQKASEQKPNKQKPSEPKPGEQKPSEQKPGEQNPNEQKPDKQKSSERKSNEGKA